MAGRGQPKKFKTKEELQDKFDEYIQYCRDNKRFPNIAGFCAYNRMTRDTFYQQKKYYSDTYNTIRQILEDEVLQDNTYRAQLYLKNTFGYKDKQTIESTNVNVELSETEADKILKSFGVDPNNL